MSDIDVQMEGVVTPTYDKRRKGYKFKKDGMEIFIKGEDQDAAMKQMSELLESKKEEDTEVHSFAEGGMEDGGLKQEGGTVDPVSGNDVPVGSTQKEVRDDIPAQLSEGEFVFPADVTRYIGLENLMELRNKAKAGLAKMDAMGQMGNSEEATMDDSIQYDDEIDQLIDNFDPNSPESMEFSQGGVVYAQQGAYIPQQQFSYGYSAPTGYTQPQTSLPSQTPFVTSPARVAVGQAPVAPELRRYVGPNNEVLMIPFYDGKPMKGYTIPAGYKFKPEEEAVTETPEIAQPKIVPDGGGDDRAKEEAEAERIANEKQLNNLLAKYDPEFAKVIAEDPFMTGKITNPYAALAATFNTISARTDAIPGVLSQFGLDAKEYENKGILGSLPGNKYDINAIREDLKANDSIRDLFGGDSDAAEEALQGTRVTAEGGLRNGKTTYTQGEAERRARARGALDGGDSQPTPTTTPSSTPTDYESEAAGISGGGGGGGVSSSDRSQTESSSGSMGSSSGGEGGWGGSAGDFGYAEGGVVEQTQRALKSSRKK